MSSSWLNPRLELLLLLLLLLGQCQRTLSLDVWAKNEALDVFTMGAQLEAAAAVNESQTNHESRINNITLIDAEETDPEDPMEPHAASLRPLSQRKLSRGKRFVAFPLGSSASAAVCLTTGVIGNPNLLYLSLGINWGIAYDLPNITWVLNNAHGWNTMKPKAALAKIKRRHRRDLYGNLETMIDSWPFEFQECQQFKNKRSLCYLKQPNGQAALSTVSTLSYEES